MSFLTEIVATARAAAREAVRTMAPSFQWATVTGVSPLRVQMDGRATPLNLTPSNLAGPLLVGDRVRVEFTNRRATIIGAAEGPPRTMQGTVSGLSPLTVTVAGVAYPATSWVGPLAVGDVVLVARTRSDMDIIGVIGTTPAGWVALPITAAGITGTLEYAVDGRTVTVMCQISGTIPTGAVTLTAALMPADYRPWTNARGSGALNANTNCGLYVAASGAVGLINDTGGTRTGGELIVTYIHA